MKKKYFINLAIMLLLSVSVFAQDASLQPKPANQRTKEMLLTLQTDLSISNDQAAKAYTPFFDFYAAQEKAMNDMVAAGQINREELKELRAKLIVERDAKLQTIFTEAQMKKFKDEVEPAMRQQRSAKN